MLIRGVVSAGSTIRLALNSPAWMQPHKNNHPATFIVSRRFAIHDSKDPRNMVDPKRVVKYEDVVNGIEDPDKVIIDVRNPDEVVTTGKIPSSINIPLTHVDKALASMSETDFEKCYQRKKPDASSELIFYCRSGKRSSEALDKALKLGYSKYTTMCWWSYYKEAEAAEEFYNVNCLHCIFAHQCCQFTPVKFSKTYIGSWEDWSSKTKGN